MWKFLCLILWVGWTEGKMKRMTFALGFESCDMSERGGETISLMITYRSQITFV
jgi:hypothetical protein